MGSSGCKDNKPSYCIRNAEFCDKPAFKSFMHHVCKKTCGECTQEAMDEENRGCIEAKPEYCQKNKFLCIEDQEERMMVKNVTTLCKLFNSLESRKEVIQK